MATPGAGRFPLQSAWFFRGLKYRGQLRGQKSVYWGDADAADSAVLVDLFWSQPSSDRSGTASGMSGSAAFGATTAARDIAATVVALAATAALGLATGSAGAATDDRTGTGTDVAGTSATSTADGAKGASSTGASITGTGSMAVPTGSKAASSTGASLAGTGALGASAGSRAASGTGLDVAGTAALALATGSAAVGSDDRTGTADALSGQGQLLAATGSSVPAAIATWLFISERSMKSVQSPNGVPPTDPTDGIDLKAIIAFTLTAECDAGQTFTTGGQFDLYVFDENVGAWSHAPGFEQQLPASASGQRRYTMVFTIRNSRCRAAFITNGIGVTGGNVSLYYSPTVSQAPPRAL